ncbi:hypothetical protein [uncultured Roseobacter sp.]|uniref:hypothetical protein n=1 Tax=uncultured Roseobacter sp. TaxID=114847 RepID=UPI002633BCF3|nr:hypothetical protein [uncultured Roseobacter sp.]
MRLITRFDLAKLSSAELHKLQRTTFGALVRSDFGTVTRRNALASLENIERELILRML